MTTKIPAELSSTPGIADSSDATAITITSAEKVGIGTANPSQLLTVESNSFPILQISNTLANNPADGAALDIVEKQDGYAASTATFGQTGVYGYRLKLNGSTNELILQSGSQTTTNDRVTVDRDTGNVTLDTGNLVIGTSGKGIDFSASSNASGMTSELLDDYEEGTYTPTSGASLTVTYAKYTKIGRLVFLNADITVGSTSGNSAFAMTLPFDGVDSYYAGLVQYNNVPEPQLAVNITTTTLNFRKLDTSFGFLTYTGVSGHRFIFSIVYTSAT